MCTEDVTKKSRSFATVRTVCSTSRHFLLTLVSKVVKRSISLPKTKSSINRTFSSVYMPQVHMQIMNDGG